MSLVEDNNKNNNNKGEVTSELLDLVSNQSNIMLHTQEGFEQPIYDSFEESECHVNDEAVSAQDKSNDFNEICLSLLVYLMNV